MEGVREYAEEMDVELRRESGTGRLVVVAFNEAGYNFIEIDFEDLKEWIRKNPNPEFGD
jgi:hypothetical protein